MNVMDLSNTGTTPKCHAFEPIVTILEGGVFGRRLGLHEVMRARPWEKSRGVGCLPALPV